ncbi:Kynureninase 1 [Colletotrichum orbiculare MAFF 240422]|uniref:Kynureninase n=1 Tax=Colletotrichum orbiculare (strain 104-T / ATCC 96160 / CBS 514.97 / LARS 414 / MAFF 240422) TaxID=1213857 RepID=N4V2G8_COLOR|nr:Kynureninase 1 [Colletotrichum orbiculare MAFF 240422]
MEIAAFAEQLRSGRPAKFPANAKTPEFAQQLDAQDNLRHLRDEFIIPTKGSLKKKELSGKFPNKESINGHSNGVNGSHSADDDDTPSVYFCGNSLGVQPKAVKEYVNAQLETWASIGVNGHFNGLGKSPLVCWQDMAEDVAKKSAPIVGALPEEVVMMNTLTANLHFLMASFYRPTEKKHKIILEWRPFPSDHYAIESQIQWHGLDPSKSMVQIQPDENFYISTDLILKTIDEHAEETALILLPGIQYYSGQLFDIPRITEYAQSKGLVVGWDLAHAAGNVELRLHDWNVDFAAWCTYKYQNAGPGAMAGAFVHERHGKVDLSEGKPQFRHRLTGWYGGDKSVRFNMDNNFLPTVGAGGFQVSNPSALDLAALSGALSVFEKTSMAELRTKALVLTAYAEHLLDGILADDAAGSEPTFRIITPRNPQERGTQLSVLLRDGLLDKVAEAFVDAGVVCDKRKPGVIRVAPVPLYCTFQDVWKFMDILRKAAA